MILINANNVYYDNDFEKWYFEDDEDFENAQVVDDNYIKENQELKQKIIEKDKEIEELKAKLETAEYWNKKYDDLQSQNDIQTIRKQVCEEIRAFFDVNPNTVEWDYLNEILNQIEQGEQQ